MLRRKSVGLAAYEMGKSKTITAEYSVPTLEPDELSAVAQPPDAARSPGQIDRPVGEFRGSGRYRADLTAGSVKIAETRVIADLLLHGVDESELSLIHI